MNSIPKKKEIEFIYLTEKNTIEYLLEKNILYNYEKCPACLDGKLYQSQCKINQWRCNSNKCQKQISVYKNSFFGKSKIKSNDLLRICYKWICGEKYSQIIKQTKHSPKSISATTRFCRELISNNIDEEENLIGGPGIIVEVDEFKFGKVKYEHGHSVKGVWILGGVERTSERRIFLKVVPDRKRDTLLNILGRCIAAGSIVHTDLWRGYMGMETYLNVNHFTVNHSQNFKDSVTSVHTNTI